MAPPTWTGSWNEFVAASGCTDWTLALSASIPSTAQVVRAGKAAGADTMRAAWSLLQLLVLLGRPVVYAILLVFNLLLQTISSYISEHYASWIESGRDALIAFYRFERSLTLTQWIGQAIVVALLLATIWLVRYLKRTHYARKIVQSYRSTVNRIADVSIMFARMIPHIFFGIAMAFCYCVAPGVFRHLACQTSLAPLILLWLPLVQSVWVVTQVRKRKAAATTTTPTPTQRGQSTVDEAASKEATQEDKENSSRQGTLTRKKRNKATTTPFPRAKTTGTRKRRRDSPYAMEGQSANEAYNEQQDLLDYWIVYASYQLLVGVIACVPLVWRFPVLKALLPFAYHVRLALAVWFLSMPRLNVRLEGQPKARKLRKSSRPLVAWMAEWIRKASREMTRHIGASNIISQEWWKWFLDGYVSPMLQTLVWTHIITAETKEWLIRDAFPEWRVLLLPAGTLFIPVVTNVAVWYPRSLLPISKARSSAAAWREGRALAALQYWILHQIVAAAVGQSIVAGFLWWIPLSNFALFVSWWYLSVPSSISRYYTLFEWELRALGLLADGSSEKRPSRIAQWIEALLRKLPRATTPNQKQEGSGLDDDMGEDGDSQREESGTEWPPNGDEASVSGQGGDDEFDGASNGERTDSGDEQHANGANGEDLEEAHDESKPRRSPRFLHPAVVS